MAKPKTVAKPGRKRASDASTATSTPSADAVADVPAPRRAPGAAPDKALVLAVLLAKLEDSKSCDWYELALRLSIASPGAAKRGKGSKAEQVMSGSELRDVYTHVILPALQAGHAPWLADVDGASASSMKDGFESEEEGDAAEVAATTPDKSKRIKMMKKQGE